MVALGYNKIINSALPKKKIEEITHIKFTIDEFPPKEIVEMIKDLSKLAIEKKKF